MTVRTPTAHALTDEQVAAFDRDGYLVLRDRIPAEVVERLRAASEVWIADGVQAGDGEPGTEDYHWATRPTGRVMYRVNYVHGKGQRASLELLGCPEVLGIAESLVGRDLVPTYESLVFKQAGDGAPIPWHQDAVHPRSARIVNVDVYLDPSLAGQGALRVLPGSQLSPADICAVRDAHGWEPPGMVEVEMAPGDVLLHDVMLVHGSPPATGNALRRTLYYEFRAAGQIREEGPWDDAWVARRMRLLPLALAAAAEARPDVAPYAWDPSPELRPDPSDDLDAELRVVHETWTPSNFCSAGDVPRLPGT